MQSRATFPGVLHYLRGWNSCRWFLLLCLPAWISVAILILDGGPVVSCVAILLFATLPALMLFHDLASGVSCSNGMMFPRATSPVGYWMSVFFLALFYALFTGLGVYSGAAVLRAHLL